MRSTGNRFCNSSTLDKPAREHFGAIHALAHLNRVGRKLLRDLRRALRHKQLVFGERKRALAAQLLDETLNAKLGMLLPAHLQIPLGLVSMQQLFRYLRQWAAQQGIVERLNIRVFVRITQRVGPSREFSTLARSAASSLLKAMGCPPPPTQPPGTP